MSISKTNKNGEINSIQTTMVLITCAKFYKIGQNLVYCTFTKRMTQLTNCLYTLLKSRNTSTHRSDIRFLKQVFTRPYNVIIFTDSPDNAKYWSA